MATSNELRAWAYQLKQWALSVDTPKVREQMVQLAALELLVSLGVALEVSLS